jgi:hypothetical protein
MDARLKIGFFGHSIAQTDDKLDFPFIEKIKKHYNAEIVNIGTALCSEERILFELKKRHTKPGLDVAVIFHANPKFTFVPSIHRDFARIDGEEEIFKLNHELIEQQKDYPDALYYNIPAEAKSATLEDLKEWYNHYEEGIQSIKNAVNVEMINDFKLFLPYYKMYMTHPDLSRNRYQGALLLLDNYLNNSDIAVVHAINPKKKEWFPNWFKFSTGLIDNTLQSFQDNESPYSSNYHNSPNAVTPEGNHIMYETLVKYIDQLLNERITK